MSIRVVFLGTSAAVPSPKRNSFGIALRFDGDVFLFDCGEGSQRQLMKYKMSYSKTKAVFVSHLHPDHLMGIPGLVFTLDLNGRKEPLHVFGPKGISRRMEELLGGWGREFVKVEDIDENFSYKSEKFTVNAFPVRHCKNSLGFVFEENEKRNFDKKKCDELGIKGRMFKELEEKREVKVGRKTVRIEEVTTVKRGRKIVFTGDTMACEEVARAAKDADLLVHDSTFSFEMKKEADEKQHATALEAAQTAKKANVKKLVLTHISNRYDDASVLEKEAKKEFENTIVADDGTEAIV
ncbi:ribonuclease Z [Candidatus Micrarchaeota archaeon]|nr:ribonuclease Z [Candidatus Micrarchaeota archaeon]